jgi:hypothetical protein
MRKLIVAMLFLLGLPDLILAEKGASDRQLLIDAEQRANVFHPDAGPFQLDVDFVVCVYAHPMTLTSKIFFVCKDFSWRLCGDRG